MKLDEENIELFTRLKNAHSKVFFVNEAIKHFAKTETGKIFFYEEEEMNKKEKNEPIMREEKSSSAPAATLNEW